MLVLIAELHPGIFTNYVMKLTHFYLWLNIPSNLPVRKANPCSQIKAHPALANHRFDRKFPS